VRQIVGGGLPDEGWGPFFHGITAAIFRRVDCLRLRRSKSFDASLHPHGRRQSGRLASRARRIARTEGMKHDQRAGSPLLRVVTRNVTPETLSPQTKGVTPAASHDREVTRPSRRKCSTSRTPHEDPNLSRTDHSFLVHRHNLRIAAKHDASTLTDAQRRLT
jgi:hypothetical protein